MVDRGFAEERRKEFLEESAKNVYPENAADIKQRYRDTALVLFKQRQSSSSKGFLSFGTRRSSAVSRYGNTPIIVRKSRSSNGELSIAEQWPSIRSRSSVSSHTLLELGDSELGDSDSDDDKQNNAAEIVNEGVEAKELNRKGSNELKKKDGAFENSSQAVASSDVKKNIVELKVHTEELLIKDGACEIRNHQTGNRKSFSQYDLPVQRPKESEEEARDVENERTEQEKSRIEVLRIIEEGDVSSIPTTVQEKEEELRYAQKVLDEGQGIRIFGNVSPRPGRRGSRKYSLTKDGIGRRGSSQEKNSPKVLKEDTSQSRDKVVRKDSLDSNSESLVKGCIQFSLNNSLDIQQRRVSNTSIGNLKPRSSYEYVELKIVEPSDLEVPLPEEGKKNYISDKDINHSFGSLDFIDDDDDDDDNAVFVDSCSSLTNLPKSENVLHIDSDREVSQLMAEIPPESKTEKYQEPCTPNTRILLTADPSKDTSDDHVDKSIETENHSGLLDLPVRSPTPPKRSPRRSPRMPKGNEETRHSLDLPSDRVPEHPPAKGVQSASPTMKSRYSGPIFSFSVKGEKNKSASSINLKKGKERGKSPLVKRKDEDPGVVNPVLVANTRADAQTEAFGKRVGVRSMVIDGTIKRNFIVIHPSDESETIGLAPLSHASNGNGSATQVSSSEALSSVKSHIVGLSVDKIESVRKISSKQDLREELPKTSEFLMSAVSGQTHRRSLRSRKTRHSVDRMRGSSQSLSDRSRHSSLTELQPVIRPTRGMSEVDCDSLNMSAQGLTLSGTSKTTSRLCVVM